MRAGFVLAACCVAPACAAAGAVIELRPEARVAGTTIVLGEVARLHADDLALMRKLVNLPLGRAPQPGDLALLQRDALAQWVRRQHGIDVGQLAWSGAAETKVLRRTSQVSGEDLAEAATGSLRSALAAQGDEASVGVRSAPRDVEVPAGAVRLEVRGVDAAMAHRRGVVWVDVWAADRFVRTVPVSVEVARGVTREEPRKEPAFPAPSAASQPPAVARGDWATLRSTDGAITIESRVEVLQDGRPGQRIRVRAQGATGPAFARVVGRGQLELLP